MGLARGEVEGTDDDPSNRNELQQAGCVREPEGLGMARPAVIRRLRALQEVGLVEWVGQGPEDPRAVRILGGSGLPRRDAALPLRAWQALDAEAPGSDGDR